jgi:starch phosphorylase
VTVTDGATTGRSIAYFSMEIAIDDDVPSFSGGLGVLAGDFLRSAADLGLPVVGVTLLYHDGYFRQRLDDEGHQRELVVRWSPEDRLRLLPQQVEVTIYGRTVKVAVWQLDLIGAGGHQVPVYFLDTRLVDNDPADQLITDQLYSGDLAHRLCQEGVLGLAGPPMLTALGHRAVETFHMNEGHSSLLTLALLDSQIGNLLDGPRPSDIDAVRSRCVFTTHTPVPAGHDRFPEQLVRDVLGAEMADRLAELGCLPDGELNMTVLGMTFSHFVNAVARRHQEVSQEMFPQFHVTSITNGVHAGRWAAPSIRRLFDDHLPGWRRDNSSLRYASTIPLDELRQAHAEAKEALLETVAARARVHFDPAVLTIGVARRATPYKRFDLLLSDPERLLYLVKAVGPIQVVYAGKAHPDDALGKEMIPRVLKAAEELAGAVPVVYLENYSLDLGGLLTAGSDVWLNTPTKPYEASGTSGMKAAVNGVPSLSILDGWWIEGHVEDVTGWAIGDHEPETGDAHDAQLLYDALERKILPLYYRDPNAFAAIMRHAISLNGSFFNTERMVREYDQRAYRAGRQWPSALRVP